MDKREAHAKILSLWRERPPAERRTYKHAIDFAATVASEVEFETLGNKLKIIEGWLVKDVDGQPVPIAKTRTESGITNHLRALTAAGPTPRSK